MTSMPRAPEDAPSPSGGAGGLPAWDLGDLYPGRDSAALAADLADAEREAVAFAARHAGKLAQLSPAAFGAAIAAYERLDERLARLTSYADLTYAGDQSDPEIGRFCQTIQERVNAIATHTLFFTLEINRLSDGDIAAKLTAPETARYAAWLRELRVFRPHQLDDIVEKLLHEKHVTGRAAWTRLFDETMAGLRFPVRGRALTSAAALHLLSDGDGGLRRDAAQSISTVLGANIKTFALITNTLAKDKEIEDKWRRYALPISARNLSNRVEDEVVEALIGAVRKAFPRLSHRYYALKARWFGVAQLEHWDRNAPLPRVAERSIGWPEARDIVLDAYARFSPELATIGRRFFDRPWIDAAVRPGKSPGAFAHPTVPGAHPYLLLNYQGRTRDVMTLAHELGHGVHQVLAAGQGHLQADTPLTLAETASIFGEGLVFERLLAEAGPREKLGLLAGQIEDGLNTVVRQMAFHRFETRFHAARRDGELSAEAIGGLWLEVMGESLGPAVRLNPGYEHYWGYISHFVHAPFYVYAYAFGDLLVRALMEKRREDPQGFVPLYEDLLASGGVRTCVEALARFDLDPRETEFWAAGVRQLERRVDALEALVG